MAANVPHKTITLDTDDVPGACLPNSDISANSVVVLKRFLSVRGVKVRTGSSKEDIVGQVRNVLKKNIPVDPLVDGGQPLKRKCLKERRMDINAAAAKNDEFDLFPITGWKAFPSIPIPSGFNDGAIYYHMIQTAVLNTELQRVSCSSDEEEEHQQGTSYATGKSLSRGRRYFSDGHIQNIKDCFSPKGHYCCKADVQASMRTEVHKVAVMLHKRTGEIVDAECDCKSSSMARCSHVGGVLLALADYISTFGFNPPSCTTMLCSWNKGRKEKSSNPIFLNQYTNKRDPARMKKFTILRNQDTRDTICDNLKYISEARYVDNAWNRMLSYHYEDEPVTEERMVVLKTLASQLQEALQFGMMNPSAIPGTEGQSGSLLWNSLRLILITASKSQMFLSSTEKCLEKLRDLMWEPKTISNAYVKYGIEHEEAARKAYVLNTGNVVQTTGLWVNPRYPGLGASPDGLITTTTSAHGLLEIKCPFILKNNSPTDLDKLTPQQRSRYCLRKVGDTFRLKKSHKFYKQIQMQMGVTGLRWCDFVIWTAKGLHVERVPFDEELWEDMSQKLMRFHREFVCPEYFEMRVPRNLQPIKLA